MFSTATGWLIVANVSIWLGMVVACFLLGAPGGGLWKPFPGSLTFLLGGLIPELLVAEPWRMITCTFLHAGLLHLVMNMLFLWFVGPRLEGAFGAARFLALYMASAIGGSIVSGTWHLIDHTPSVGASGAIMGVLGGLFALSWKGLGFRHPMTKQWWQIAIIGFVMGIVSNLLGGNSLDNAAHIGGWGAGIGVALLFAGKRPWSTNAQRAVIGLSIAATIASFGAALAFQTSDQHVSESGTVKKYNDALKAGDWPGAEKALGPMLAESPNNIDLRVRHAVILDHLDQKPAATTELLAAAKLDGSAEQFGELASLLAEHGETAAARRCAKIAQIKDPGNPAYPQLLHAIDAASSPKP